MMELCCCELLGISGRFWLSRLTLRYFWTAISNITNDYWVLDEIFKSELNRCTLKVCLVLSNTKVFWPNTNILAYESNSERGSTVPSILSVATIV